jgi:iron complex transport system ATP-binding protein
MDRVILMKGGRIVADGSTNKVLTAERLSELFGLTLDLTQRDGYYNLW